MLNYSKSKNGNGIYCYYFTDATNYPDIFTANITDEVHAKSEEIDNLRHKLRLAELEFHKLVCETNCSDTNSKPFCVSCGLLFSKNDHIDIYQFKDWEKDKYLNLYQCGKCHKTQSFYFNFRYGQFLCIRSKKKNIKLEKIGGEI